MEHLAYPNRGWLSALWGGLLSLSLAGLGQVYAGIWEKGVSLLFIDFLLLCLSYLTTKVFSPILPTVIALVAIVVCTILFHIATAISAVRHIRAVGAGPRQRWFHSTWLAAGAFLALHFLTPIGITPGWRSFNMSSQSGLPTLLPGDVVVATVPGVNTHPTRGIMAAFSLPGRNPSAVYTGRVVGLPGDRIQVTRGVLYLNGTSVSREKIEDFTYDNDGRMDVLPQYLETLPNGAPHHIVQLADGPLDNTSLFVVPANSFFYLGDNRSNAADSRVSGFVPAGNFIGNLQLIILSKNPGRIGTRVE